VALNSSRIYNPVTNTWSPTITMPVPAIGQRAAKLPDGTVLVAGGSSGTPVYTVLAHTAIFNPSTQSWLTTGSLTTQRRAHTLTVLASGGVLAVGGYPDNGVIPTTSAEHFPPNTPPVNKAPTSSLLMGALQQTTIPITIVWSANDPDGIASYQLQQRLNGGEFSNVALPTPLTKSIVRQLDPAATHRFRVSATDQRGATSAYTIGKPLSIVVQQEDSASIVFTGAWTANANASFYGGGARTASSPASATLTFSGTSVSWVTSKGPGRGKAEVWLDGVKRATIDLYTPTARNRQVVFARNGLAAGNHTIEIRPLGTKNAASTGTGVVLDAIVVLP
jgi:hypothetical protein